MVSFTLSVKSIFLGKKKNMYQSVFDGKVGKEKHT